MHYSDQLIVVIQYTRHFCVSMFDDIVGALSGIFERALKNNFAQLLTVTQIFDFEAHTTTLCSGLPCCNHRTIELYGFELCWSPLAASLPNAR
jgi:hypothetical protein